MIASSAQSRSLRPIPGPGLKIPRGTARLSRPPWPGSKGGKNEAVVGCTGAINVSSSGLERGEVKKKKLCLTKTGGGWNGGNSSPKPGGGPIVPLLIRRGGNGVCGGGGTGWGLGGGEGVGGGRKGKWESRTCLGERGTTVQGKLAGDLRRGQGDCQQNLGVMGKTKPVSILHVHQCKEKEAPSTPCRKRDSRGLEANEPAVCSGTTKETLGGTPTPKEREGRVSVGN